jgi:hypothetical protein
MVTVNTLCCHWCGVPLSQAFMITYANGNLPVCDLCLRNHSRPVIKGWPGKVIIINDWPVSITNDIW